MHITENTTNRDAVLATREVDSYIGYIEGDYETSLGKTIKTLIIAAESFIVYIDENNCVEWTYNSKYKGSDTFLEKFGVILNKMSFLEELSNDKLDKNQLQAFRRLLGESVGRLLNERSDKNALVILKTAESLLNYKNRQYLILSALIATLIVGVLEFFLWLNHQPEWRLLSAIDKLYPVIFCSLAGGFGGFIFLMLRSKSLELDAALSKKLYAYEGILRIVYGIMGALLAYLAINAKLVFGNIDRPTFSVITILICIVSGVSEKIIPGIIKKVESKL